MLQYDVPNEMLHYSIIFLTGVQENHHRCFHEMLQHDVPNRNVML